MNTETNCKTAGDTEDHFHDTRLLLRQYRQISYAVKLSENDLGDRTEKEHRIRMSVLEINAALAGIDLSGSKLESYTKSICRSRSMLRIIENALELVRMDPDNGEMLYQILYLTYFCDQRLPSRDAILIALSRKGFAMSPPTYHKYLKLGILAMDRILWGYTALDLNKISEELCSKVALTSSPPGS